MGKRGGGRRKATSMSCCTVASGSPRWGGGATEQTVPLRARKRRRGGRSTLPSASPRRSCTGRGRAWERHRSQQKQRKAPWMCRWTMPLASTRRARPHPPSAGADRGGGRGLEHALCLSTRRTLRMCLSWRASKGRVPPRMSPHPCAGCFHSPAMRLRRSWRPCVGRRWARRGRASGSSCGFRRARRHLKPCGRNRVPYALD
mmetsp:Transcript_19048/g.61108  ORF Transcript_19048/g.61108 Transcript_19048/m.61108 type:complete len:202 (+) Transcript_19048:319-924(+)